MNKNWLVEPLSTTKHERKNFRCGVEVLDNYLKKQASIDSKRRFAQVFVLVDKMKASQILGYYTLSSSSFSKEKLPETKAKKLPHYPVPAVILGRLAIHSDLQGQGAGEYLLMDVFYRVLSASKVMGVYAIVVDAKNERVKTFYESYGFISFKNESFRLFITLKTLEELGN